MKIPQWSFRLATDYSKIALLSLEARSLFEELSRPSEEEIVPGLRPLPDVASYILAELIGTEGVLVDFRGGLILLIDQVFQRPPMTSEEVRKWVKKIQGCPESKVRFTIINILDGVCTFTDLAHRPLSDALRESLGGELEAVEKILERLGKEPEITLPPSEDEGGE